MEVKTNLFPGDFGAESEVETLASTKEEYPKDIYFFRSILHTFGFTNVVHNKPPMLRVKAEILNLVSPEILRLKGRKRS